MGFTDKFEEWSESLFAKTRDVTTDLTTLDVTTSVGDAVQLDIADLFGKDLDFETLKDKDVTIAGMTRLDLTGDLIEIVHGAKTNGVFKVDEELLKLHKENLEIGIESWNNPFYIQVQESGNQHI